MWWVRVVLATGAAVLAGGCAGARARQDLARLQSQVSLLDERVMQLERSGSAGGSGVSSGGEPVMESGAMTEPASASRRPVGRPTGSGASSLKPSTRQIQQALKNAGFYQGSVDGKMGPKTREALREFQRIHGLKDDGVAGKLTWGKLKAYADLSGSGGEATAGDTFTK